MTKVESAGRSVLINIRGVSKTFVGEKGKSQAAALCKVNTQISKGELVSFVGPSGCGKTTLLKMCCGLIRPTTGEIDYQGTGQPLTPGSYGMVFQTPALLPWRTVGRNIELPGTLKRGSRYLGTERSVQSRIADLLETVGLKGTENRYPHELSGGMQQRVAIARALYDDPSVLFMDEPFGALDAITRERLNLEVQSILQHKNLTIIFVTHDLREALFLSDRVIVFSNSPGRIVADVRINLPRPRSMSSFTEPEMIEAEHLLRKSLQIT
jgi:NitT/TauT family transport system ATP-binding protein